MNDLVKTPERLKQSILQEAMQGKLTKQLSSDGDARELLKPIFKRKHFLLKNKRIRNHKRLPKIHNIPFDIPNNWQWIRLLSLYDFINGRQPPKSQWINNSKNGYIRMYKIRDYGPNPKPIYIPKSTVKQITHEGDILAVNHGSSIGKVLHAHFGTYTGNMARITPITDISELYKGFLWYYLKSNLYLLFISSIHRSAQPCFNRHDLEKLLIPVPPLAEQHRIVQRLNEILSKVDDLNKDVVKLDSIQTKFPHRLKQSLLLEAMKGNLTQQLPSDGNADDLLQSIQQKKQQLIQAGKIRKHKKLSPISKDEIPFEIPKNWRWVRLDQLTLIISGRDIPKRKQSKLNDVNNIPYVTGAGNFISSHIITNTFLNKNLASVISIKNDLLITVKGTVGKLAFLPFKEAHIARQIIAIRFLGNMIPMFIFYLLQLTKVKLSNESKSIIPGIKRSNLENLLVPLPPLSEQHRIVSKLHDFLTL